MALTTRDPIKAAGLAGAAAVVESVATRGLGSVAGTGRVDSPEMTLS